MRSRELGHSVQPERKASSGWKACAEFS
jgi:hypothetical protein